MPAFLTYSCSLLVWANYAGSWQSITAAPLLKNELSISASQLGILFSSFFWTYTALLFLRLVCRSNALTSIEGWRSVSLRRSPPPQPLPPIHDAADHALILVWVSPSLSRSYSKPFAQLLPEHARGFANGAIIAGMKLGPAAEHASAFGARLPLWSKVVSAIHKRSALRRQTQRWGSISTPQSSRLASPAPAMTHMEILLEGDAECMQNADRRSSQSAPTFAQQHNVSARSWQFGNTSGASPH